MKSPLVKRIALITAGIALLAGIGLLIKRGPISAVSVTTAKVETADLSPKIFGIGTVEARRAYLVGPTSASRVTRVLVDHGDRVRAGQLLAELDPVDLDERLASITSAMQRASSAMRSAEAQLRETVSRSTLAAASAARFSDLRQKGFVSQEAVELKAHEANAANAARQAAEAAVETARLDVSRLEADRAGLGRQRAQFRLLSPTDGVVSSRDAEPGSTVVAGQAVLRLIDPQSLWVKARIDQARAGSLAVGQPVQITLRSQPQAPVAGKVARIEVSSDSVTEERLVAIGFDSLPAGLPVGELVEVSVQLPVAKAVASLPSAAIRRIGQQSGVWRIVDGKAAFAPVRTGLQTLDGRTQIVDGLQPGDGVIHQSAQELRADERVRVVDSLVAAARP